jgi:hypothetical protein
MIMVDNANRVVLRGVCPPEARGVEKIAYNPILARIILEENPGLPYAFILEAIEADVTHSVRCIVKAAWELYASNCA